jgi:hypothetical protein
MRMERPAQFRISMQTPVEDPLMTIESFNRQFQIGEKGRDAVKWGWEQEMGKCMFHVVNEYTGGPSLKDCRRRGVIGPRRWRGGAGDGEVIKGQIKYEKCQIYPVVSDVPGILSKLCHGPEYAAVLDLKTWEGQIMAQIAGV